MLMLNGTGANGAGLVVTGIPVVQFQLEVEPVARHPMEMVVVAFCLPMKVSVIPLKRLCGMFLLLRHLRIERENPILMKTLIVINDVAAFLYAPVLAQRWAQPLLGVY